MRYFQSLGVDLGTEDNSGRTPAYCAAGKGHDAVLRCLRSLGVDLATKDTAEKILAHVAANAERI